MENLSMEKTGKKLIDAKSAKISALKFQLGASASGWQTIETAPKDNARLLYLARIDKDGEMLEIDFDGVWQYWQESWEMPHINGYEWEAAQGIEEPTHWAYQDAPIPTLISQAVEAENAALKQQLKKIK